MEHGSHISPEELLMRVREWRAQHNETPAATVDSRDRIETMLPERMEHLRRLNESGQRFRGPAEVPWTDWFLEQHE